MKQAASLVGLPGALLILFAAGCGGGKMGVAGDTDAADDTAAREPAGDPALEEPPDVIEVPLETPSETPAEPDSADAAGDPPADRVEEELLPAGITFGLTGRSFTYNGTETFVLAASYYGACGAPEARISSDLGRLAALGFNHIRVWATWTVPDSGASVMRDDGTLDGAALGRLKFLIETAQSGGMTVDVTTSIGIENSSNGGFEAYKAGVRAIAQALLPYRNVFFDMGNERDVMDARYLSPEQIRDLAAAVREVDPARIATVSSGGTPESAASQWDELYTIADLPLACPHFPRNEVWASETENRLNAMRALLLAEGWDRPIYLQEEARRGYSGAEWPKSDFLTAAAGAKAAGAAGWCFHTGAGFDLSALSFFDQLDEVELDTIDELAAAAGM